MGLGLWRSVPATAAVEGLFFAGALRLYFSGTRARDRIGRWGAVGLAAWLLVPWAWWVERHREPATVQTAPS